MRRAIFASLWLLLPSFAFAGGKLGVGSGLFWGTPLVGGGAELDVGKYLSVLGGVGVGSYRSPWSLGARISFAPPDKKWRPHLTGIRWTEGYGVYAGVDHDVGKPGRWVLTYGLGYGDVNPEAKIGTAIGIGYRF
jgi:hypothetical protein